jgi:hypothetical protein
MGLQSAEVRNELKLKTFELEQLTAQQARHGRSTAGTL